MNRQILGEVVADTKDERMADPTDLSPGSRHLYQSVYGLLLEKINNDDFPQGLHLKEGQLTNILGVSRAPVRRALDLLHEKGFVREASGQGYLVGKESESIQIGLKKLSSILISKKNVDVGRNVAWEGIYHEVKDEVTKCLPFGTYRVLETKLGQHFSVSRTVVREVLARLSDRKLIEKDRRSHWIAGPLTANDIRETTEMRQMLEPRALAEVAPKIEVNILREMRERVAVVEANPGGACHTQIEIIENDLHRRILNNVSNKRLLTSIDQNQLHFIVPNLFRRQFGNALDMKAMADHALILDQLLNRQFEVACVALEAHLKRSQKDIVRKLRVLSVLSKPVTAPYLVNIH